jgi:hypothetical protein
MTVRHAINALGRSHLLTACERTTIDGEPVPVGRLAVAGLVIGLGKHLSRVPITVGLATRTRNLLSLQCAPDLPRYTVSV